MDIVVLASADEGRLAEARRVAAGALVRIDPSYRDTAEVESLSGDSGRWGENVNVILIPGDEDPAWGASLGALAETLDDDFAGRLSAAGTQATLARLGMKAAGAGIDVRLIEVEAAAGAAQRARAAIADRGGQLQVFITAPAVPLPGWLESILALSSRDADVGVIGTRILTRFGTLEEAGGVLAADGSPRRRGEGDQDPDRPEYSFVRRVDFCSSPLVATRPEVFERLGGFGNGQLTGTEAIADFSLRASQSGTPVYYQPQARIVKLSGASG